MEGSGWRERARERGRESQRMLKNEYAKEKHEERETQKTRYGKTRRQGIGKETRI